MENERLNNTESVWMPEDQGRRLVEDEILVFPEPGRSNPFEEAHVIRANRWLDSEIEASQHVIDSTSVNLNHISEGNALIEGDIFRLTGEIVATGNNNASVERETLSLRDQAAAYPDTVALVPESSDALSNSVERLASINDSIVQAAQSIAQATANGSVIDSSLFRGHFEMTLSVGKYLACSCGAFLIKYQAAFQPITLSETSQTVLVAVATTNFVAIGFRLLYPKTSLKLINSFFPPRHNADSCSTFQTVLQDPCSPSMEGIFSFNGQLLSLITVIIVLTAWIIAIVLEVNLEVSRNEVEEFHHSSLIEILWTSFPALILLCLSIPSFSLLYAMDEVTAAELSMKIIGHQWFWSYENSDFMTCFEAGNLKYSSYLFSPELLKPHISRD